MKSFLTLAILSTVGLGAAGYLAEQARTISPLQHDPEALERGIDAITGRLLERHGRELQLLLEPLPPAPASPETRILVPTPTALDITSAVRITTPAQVIVEAWGERGLTYCRDTHGTVYLCLDSGDLAPLSP